MKRTLNFAPLKLRLAPLKHDTFLDYYLCESHLECHRGHLRLDDYYLKVLTLKEPSAQSFPLIFKALLEVQANFHIVSLDKLKGMNQIGDIGLRDQVNNHYLKIFGASLAIGAIGGVAEARSGSVLTQSGTQSVQQGIGESLGQTSQRVLDKFLNILPTVTIREGHRVKIYLSGDLALPDYANHKMPSDL